MDDKGHTFYLNVSQLYRPIEVKSKYQIRKIHHVHVNNLKMFIKYNPYAHVIDYWALADPAKVPNKEAFDISNSFYYSIV